MADDINFIEAARRRSRSATGKPAGGKPGAAPSSRSRAKPAPIGSPRPAASPPQPATPPAVRPAPSISTGGSGPPVPPTGRSLTTSPAASPGPGARPTGGQIARSAMPPLRPGALPRGGGGLAALGFAAGEGFDRARDYVNRENPRVLATEDLESRATGTSTRAFDPSVPSRVPGRYRGRPAVAGGEGPLVPHDPPEGLGPRGASPNPPAPSRPMDAPAAPRSPARPAAPRRPTRGGLSEADVLNAAELGRINRVKQGDTEAIRPPQFAKGGMVKKPGISKPSIGKFGSAPGRPPSPPKGPKLPAFLTKAKPPKPPTAPKPKALPFAKGGMPKGKQY